MSSVAIIGTGVIGTGWTARLLAHGHAVRAWDPSPGFGQRLVNDIERLWPTLERTGLAGDASRDNLTIADSLADACRDASFVQESAPENLAIKQALLAEIDKAAPVDAIVASSSSGLLPSEIQSPCENPGRILVGHPFNPVYLLPLVEIVAGEKTDQTNVSRITEFYRGIGMIPLVVRREIEGYLSDRLQEALWREILHLVKDGVATTAELDDAVRYGPGLRWAIMGTCLTFHLAGGEGGMRHMLEQFGPALELPWTKLVAPELTPELIDRMVEGTARQAGDQSIAALEKLRDDCLIDIMAVLDKYRDQLEKFSR